jgi:hypothetical protein
MASGNILPPYRELAHRLNDGLEVILSWQKLTDELTITVSDERGGAISSSSPLRTRARPDGAMTPCQGMPSYATLKASKSEWSCDERAPKRKRRSS